MNGQGLVLGMRLLARPVGCVAVILVLLVCCKTLTAEPVEEPLKPVSVYRMVWNDEFDGPALDETEWEYRITTRSDPGTKAPVSICLPRNISVVDGKMKIQMKIEDYEGFANTCGGIITKKRYKYGYYEVSARMDETERGWHEAFWSAAGGNWPWPEGVGDQPWFEMDGFEHYGSCGPHTVSYGLIEWPVHRSVSREMLETDIDLGKTYNRYGMEYTPDYFAFYFNDLLLQVVNISDLGHGDMLLWLSCVSTNTGIAKADGECFFDYLRCYAIDYGSPAYQKRKEAMLARMMTDSAALDPEAVSQGADLWIEAENFVSKAGWQAEQDTGKTFLYDGKMERSPSPGILKGHTNSEPKPLSWQEKTARTMIDIPHAGTWKVWVRARDFEKTAPGSRYCNVAVNGKYFEPRMGTHGQEGQAWQLAGQVELQPGPASIELIDSSQFYTRVDRLLLTTDPDYVPEGPGNVENVKHTMDEAQFRSAQPTE
ncbi:family 16 glycosylhydrolase [bacterium]|nr:family 16 glycosylhydrolase [bacterium]